MTTVFSPARPHHSSAFEKPPSSSHLMSSDHARSGLQLPEKHSRGFQQSTPPSSMNSSFAPQGNSTLNPFPTPTSSAPPTVQPTTNVDMEDVSMGGIEGGSFGGKRKQDVSAEEFHDQNRDHNSASQASRSKRLKSGELETPKASGPVPTIEEILEQSNVGPLYLTSSKPFPKMYPDAQTNLLDAYGLQSIADSVARQDKQGNKINKLRKSYKRYIQDLPGKEDYPPKEPTGKPDFDKTLPKPGMDLMEMLILPEEEWQNRYVHGKDITRGLELGALRRACQLGSTPIPNFDASVLGIDESEAAAAVLGQPPARNPKQKPAFAASAMGYNNSHHHPNSGRGTPNYHSTSSYNGTPGAAPYSTHSPLPSKNAELKRPSRKKRRRYDDQSFEGYEGFDTDDDVKGGSKRKKDYDLGNNHPTSIPGRITIGGGGGDAYGR